MKDVHVAGIISESLHEVDSDVYAASMKACGFEKTGRHNPFLIDRSIYDPGLPYRENAVTPPFLKSLYSKINLESPPGTAFMTPLRIDPFPQFKPKPEIKEVAKFRTKLNEKQPYGSTQFQFALVQSAKERVQNDIGAGNHFWKVWPPWRLF